MKKNRLYAMMLIGLGLISKWVLNDGTFLVLALLIGGALFFEKENMILE